VVALLLFFADVVVRSLLWRCMEEPDSGQIQKEKYAETFVKAFGDRTLIQTVYDAISQ